LLWRLPSWPDSQKAGIEAVNAKWMEFFNQGNFSGIASLYTEDATAFPPGSGMVKGRAAIGSRYRSARLVGFGMLAEYFRAG
jgi:ketosteroid isomerase-like protein